jgi:hypothetical protein
VKIFDKIKSRIQLALIRIRLNLIIRKILKKEYKAFVIEVENNILNGTSNIEPKGIFASKEDKNKI